MNQINNPTKRIRILIADDVQETRRNTRLMVAAVNNTEVVAIASNGRQAVEMTEEQRPDIVILDINMPEMDGLTAYKHIRQAHPNTACIIISSENDPVTVNVAKSIGVQEFLVKPFIIEELETAIKNVMQHLQEVRKKNEQPNPANMNSVAYLEQLANEYLKEGRTDDLAVQIFERLALNPECSLRWLETLVMIYAIRAEWAKLITLAERLENKTKK